MMIQIGNTIIKLTQKEKLILRNQTKDELIRLETINNDLETIALLDSFKNKFNICESVYKVVLSEHQRQKGHNNAYIFANPDKSKQTHHKITEFQDMPL